MDNRLWKEVDSADIPELEQIMESVDPGSQKWLRAQARLEKLRQERAAAEVRAQHAASHRVSSRTLRWTIIGAIAAIVAAIAGVLILFPRINLAPPHAATVSPALSPPATATPTEHR